MTVERFMADVGTHGMTVLLDQGLYRHLKFKATKDSWNMWFEVVTWPNHLTISGDMGTWCFSRVDDMFSFFRQEKLRINESYWAEKLHNGVHGGSREAKVFSEEIFAAQALERVDHCFDEGDPRIAEVKEALREEVLCHDNEFELYRAASDFTHEHFQFDSGEIPSGKTYTYHYLWCLYAIVWGIQQYDQRAVLKPELEPAEPKP